MAKERKERCDSSNEQQIRKRAREAKLKQSQKKKKRSKAGMAIH